MAKITEDEVEDAALEWLAELGYAVLAWAGHRPGRFGIGTRHSYGEVLLTRRLREALVPPQPTPARRDA